MYTTYAISWLTVFVLDVAASPFPAPSPSTLSLMAPNITPSDQVGWYSPPNLRGTTNILYSCLSTLFVCLWVVLQLNVPAPHHSLIIKTLRKAKWMILGYGASEWLFMIALIQRHEAAQALWEMWKRGYGNWTIAHGFYLNMGGIVLDVGGHRRFPITYKQLVVLLDRSVVTLPDISEDEIKDKSKADGFAKAVSCMQVGWLAVQSIARAKQHLPLTTLELTTLGFVANSLVVFYIWWEKPTDVQVPTVLRMENKTDEALRQLFGEDNLKWDGIARNEDIIQLQRVYNDSDLPSGTSIGAIINGIGAVIVSYGALHCAAWNFSFPTTAERTLWRVCSIVTTFALPVGLGSAAWIKVKIPNLTWKALYLVRCISWASTAFYVISRSYLLLESLFDLRSLPAAAYEDVQWTNFLPHF
ncbi:MAG: hypothetical protein FRX48_05676 [Lasallia pustulata]|uniref:Uncharacterized protein n=1 Tax=Lasallia pustulata TaxID=136370 RepID=A0A5M8PLC3_9LECA|nr:MAG: hypothetical protein FRX48_05676 [Lasallia pustulata]